MAENKDKLRFSPAHIAGMCLLPTALLMGLVRIDFALLPLSLFLGLCAVAPFFPRMEFFLPVVNRGKTGRKAIALTFDDGPDPVSTPFLLDLLSRHEIHATFFVNGCKAARYPALIRQILREGHSLGNHSHGHDNLLMLRSERILKREIVLVQQELEKFGVKTHAFRPPVCVTNPKLGKVLQRLDMYAVGFGCRGLDAGNRWIKALSARILRKIRQDDILLLHDVTPPKEELLPTWQREMELLVRGLAADGFIVLPLASFIGKEVMSPLPKEVEASQKRCTYRPVRPGG